MKHKRPDSNSRMDKNTLIRVYKTFKRKPKKIFTVSEIFPGTTKRGVRYLHLLKVLDLIEILDTTWKCGENGKIMMNTKGYRLKKSSS